MAYFQGFILNRVVDFLINFIKTLKLVLLTFHFIQWIQRENAIVKSNWETYFWNNFQWDRKIFSIKLHPSKKPEAGRTASRSAISIDIIATLESWLNQFSWIFSARNVSREVVQRWLKSCNVICVDERLHGAVWLVFICYSEAATFYSLNGCRWNY